MIQLTDKHFAVEVPCGANSFRIQCHDEVFIETYIPTLVFFSEQTQVELDGELLSPGSWRFLFTTREATEAQMIKLVGIPEQDVVHGWNREIFNDWLVSKGCDVSKNWAIIQNL